MVYYRRIYDLCKPYRIVLFSFLISFVIITYVRMLYLRVPFQVMKIHDKVLTNGNQFKSCTDVAERMLKGHWVLRNFTLMELEERETEVNNLRQVLQIPLNLQRQDGKCGSVTFEHTDMFRALCDPKGPTPCCHNNVCVNRSVEECRCPQCYDMRPLIYAELAEWTTDDPTCKMLKFKNKEEICQVLKDQTLYIIGDSLLRQYCIALKDLLFNSESTRASAKSADRKKCEKHYAYLNECQHIIDKDFLACGNTTKVHCTQYWKADQVKSVLSSFKELSGKNNSWFIYGIGMHDGFNTKWIKSKALEPLLAEVARSEWPRLIWIEPHSPSLLKSPALPHQLPDRMVPYNAEVISLMSSFNVPVLKFFSMTQGIVSFDGLHYLKGVNDIKVQILLNYILEQRTQFEF